MRERSSISTLVLNTFCVSVILTISACSSNDKGSSVANNGSQNKQSKAGLKKVKDKDLKHSHPSNPCTVALAHSHVYENKDHEHKYDCESTNEYISNGHVHEATEKNKRFRHVHPNGANKHSHYR